MTSMIMERKWKGVGDQSTCRWRCRLDGGCLFSTFISLSGNDNKTYPCQTKVALFALPGVQLRFCSNADAASFFGFADRGPVSWLVNSNHYAGHSSLPVNTARSCEWNQLHLYEEVERKRGESMLYCHLLFIYKWCVTDKYERNYTNAIVYKSRWPRS